MTRLIKPETAREIAYDWHVGQWSPLYAFASSGLIENLQVLLSEINYCRELAETLTEKRRIDALHRFCSSGLIARIPGKYPYAAPWAIKD